MNPPSLPPSAPFTPVQRAWINGFLAGWFVPLETTSTAPQPSPAAQAPPASQPLLILYGSQTGTAQALAKRLARQAPEHGFEADLKELNACLLPELARHQQLLLLTSTWGDGDPPDNAAHFWQQLSSNQAPPLSHLRFSVLALGDRNYSDFCGAGRKFDERLEQLGATRLHPRAECDVDYESTATQWMSGVWNALASAQTQAGSPLAPSSPPKATPDSLTPIALPVRLINNRLLNALGSDKETRHFEFALPQNAPPYEAGDALGVEPTNCPALVAELLQALGCDGEEAVPDANRQETSLRQALLRSYSLGPVQVSLLEALAEQTQDPTLQRLIDPANQQERQTWLAGREIIDLLLACPAARFDPRQFVGYLRKLQPRLYSICSSPKAHPGQVHLTVGIVRYAAHGRPRQGVCSTFLADRLNPETPLPVFFRPARQFRLPSDPNRAILMIGPGTGIAPFRAFLHERRALGAPGRNWLFFGDQKSSLDFLYREELEEFLQDGTLHRLDTAFSRDQPEKIYVQRRLLERASEVYDWLENGAHLYVCGDARRMAKDVDAALEEIIQQAGRKTAEQAGDYLNALKSQQRYQRDVY